MAEDCNYALEPVYGQNCVQAGTGNIYCTPYFMHYNVVYYCNNVQSIRPQDLNDPYGGAATVPGDVGPYPPPEAAVKEQIANKPFALFDDVDCNTLQS